MTYTLLEENIEAHIMFATAPIYVAILVWLQSKNLKVLEKLKSKRTNEKEKKTQLQKLKRLKRQTPFLMLIGLSVHLITYVSCIDTPARSGYYISIAIMYVIYTLISYLNFYLKGAGVLKDIGDFNGLPGL